MTHDTPTVQERLDRIITEAGDLVRGLSGGVWKGGRTAHSDGPASWSERADRFDGPGPHVTSSLSTEDTDDRNKSLYG